MDLVCYLHRHGSGQASRLYQVCDAGAGTMV
jgi:hypothetical protein